MSHSKASCTHSWVPEEKKRQMERSSSLCFTWFYLFIYFWFLLTQEDSACLCHLHAAKLIINGALHVQPYVTSPASDPEPSCVVCVKQKEPYQSTAYTTHTLLGCFTRSGNLRLCLCIGVIKLAAGVCLCLSLLLHWNIFCVIVVWQILFVWLFFFSSLPRLVFGSLVIIDVWICVVFLCMHACTHTQMHRPCTSPVNRQRKEERLKDWRLVVVGGLSCVAEKTKNFACAVLRRSCTHRQTQTHGVSRPVWQPKPALHCRLNLMFCGRGLQKKYF